MENKDDMAYDKDKLEKQAIEAAKDNNLIFLSEVHVYLPCAERTFYDLQLHKSQELKEILQKNRVSQKVKMRKKWYASDNAALQISAYKLLADQHELDRLTINKNQNENKDVDKFEIIEEDGEDSEEQI